MGATIEDEGAAIDAELVEIERRLDSIGARLGTGTDAADDPLYAELAIEEERIDITIVRLRRRIERLEHDDAARAA